MDSKPLRFLTQQSFFAAVGSGELESVKQLLDSLTKDEPCDGSSTVSDLMATRNESGATGLYVAAENNSQEIFSYLLKFCDVEIVKISSNSDMNTFHVAAKLGHLGIVYELLGIWPELCKICDSTNTSPLYSAVVKGHSDVVKAILSANAGCIRIVPKNGKTALHTATRYGLTDVVKALINCDQGIVSVKDKKGQTALHIAIRGHCPEVVDILLADRSILKERDKKGNTALHIATRKTRLENVKLLLDSISTDSRSTDVNAENYQQETAMDLAVKIKSGESALEIIEALTEAGAKHASYTGQIDEATELKRTVSDIKHEVHSQFIQNEKTNRRVTGIAKELRKLHREAVQNNMNFITILAVLLSSIAFLAIFNLPSQYKSDGPDTGRAKISHHVGFQVFCLLNSISLFMSLSVVVVQITLVAWDTTAQKQVVSVVNKLMWANCACTCGAFLSIAFVVVGKRSSRMAVSITIIGAPILGTLASMCYFVLRQRFGIFWSNSQRQIKRASGSKSFC